MLQQDALGKLDVFFNQYRPLTYKQRSVISYGIDSELSVFYIKHGFMRVFRLSEQGEELTLTILKPKDFFPLTYGMTNSSLKQSYYLEAITPLEIWKVHSQQFLTFIKSDPNIYFELTRRAMVRFDNVLTKMEYLIFSNAYTKIAATLLSCAKKFGEVYGNSVRIPVPLTHKDIATLVGITRETTSLEMKKLEKRGYLSRNGRLFVLNNLEKLEEEIILQTGGKSPLSHSI